MGVRLLVQLLNVREVVLIQDVLLVVALVHQVLQLLLQVVEEHRVLVNVLQEVLASGLTVRVELDASVRVVQVELRVQRVVVQRPGRELPLRLCRCSFLPKLFQSFANSGDILRRTEELELIHVGNPQLGRDDVARDAVGLAEVSVSPTRSRPCTGPGCRGR